MPKPDPIVMSNSSASVVTNDREQGSPRFFGSADAQLFGVLYTPEKANRGAVLVCHPIGHEYLRTYQAVSSLSSSLCQQGYSVLHFDYSGTGDSSGSGSQASLHKWQQDVQVAAQYLRAKSGQQSTHVCTIRMGALVVLSARPSNMSSLTLWDPVLKGEDWFEEQSGLHRQAKKNPHRFLWTQNQNESDEIFGYKFSGNLKTSLCELKMSNYLNNMPEKIQIIRSQSTMTNKDFLGKLDPANSNLDSAITNLNESFNWSNKGFSEQHLTADLVSHSTNF